MSSRAHLAPVVVIGNVLLYKAAAAADKCAPCILYGYDSVLKYLMPTLCAVWSSINSKLWHYFHALASPLGINVV